MTKSITRYADAALVLAAVVFAGAAAARYLFPERTASREVGVGLIELDSVPAEVLAGTLGVGPSHAPVTIVEFSDFECPACAAAQPELRALRDRYPNDVRILYRHFPLRQHPNAEAAAVASECAATQGRFSEYHDLLWAKQASLASAAWTQWAAQVGVADTALFSRCLTLPSSLARVQADARIAFELGVNATPTFLVGTRLVTGIPPRGVLDDWVRRLIDSTSR